MKYIAPGKKGSIVELKKRYGNYIGGEFVAPIDEKYFVNKSPINGDVIAEFPRSTAADVEKALDAAHKAALAWGETSVEQRSKILLQIADRIDENLEKLAVAETWDNGKPIAETKSDDIPGSANHFRYFAGCIRAQEGGISVIDSNTTAYHYYEPVGVVGQIVPWNFPIMMAAWKLAPALAAGNTVVLKPAEQTPLGMSILMEVIGDLLPAGVVNIVQGFGAEVGEALASSKRIGKIAFTGSTITGRKILHHAAENIIPSTVELGGKSPNIFFEDIAQSEKLFERAAEGALLAFYNQGEVCTCPSRILVQESIANKFIARLLEKIKNIKHGDPLDEDTVLGSQVSQSQFDKIVGYFEIAKQEGAQILAGGKVNTNGEFSKGFYIEPTIIKGTNDMRVFQEEIFGPVVSLTTFKDEAEAIAIANDSPYGLASGVWTKDVNRIHRMGKAIKAGRVSVNNYHACPDHAAFGGYKESGIGRETHLMTLKNYQLVKNLVITYDEEPLGIF